MPTEITVQQYKPSEIIGILRNHLVTGQVNQRVVSLRGIYFKGTYVNQYFHTATDRLVDEITAKINTKPRKKLNFSTPIEEFFN